MRRKGGNDEQVRLDTVVLYNATGRKRVEEELRESEERFRIMADGCPAIMWVTDAGGRNQFTNRKYREFCGSTSEQLNGNSWHLAIHPDDAPGYLREFQRATRERSSFAA